MAKKARRCKPCKTRTCHKRKGSPRFGKSGCKAKFKACQRAVVKQTGSFKSAGACMVVLHKCAGHKLKPASVAKLKKLNAMGLKYAASAE